MFLSGKLSPSVTNDNTIQQAAEFVKKTLEGKVVDRSVSLGNKRDLEMGEDEK